MGNQCAKASKADATVVFSGDGDLAYVFEYLHEAFKKTIYIFGARNHVGKELVDGKKKGIIADILFSSKILIIG